MSVKVKRVLSAVVCALLILSLSFMSFAEVRDAVWTGSPDSVAFTIYRNTNYTYVLSSETVYDASLYTNITEYGSCILRLDHTTGFASVLPDDLLYVQMTFNCHVNTDGIMDPDFPSAFPFCGFDKLHFIDTAQDLYPSDLDSNGDPYVQVFYAVDGTFFTESQFTIHLRSLPGLPGIDYDVVVQISKQYFADYGVTVLENNDNISLYFSGSTKTGGYLGVNNTFRVQYGYDSATMSDIYQQQNNAYYGGYSGPQDIGGLTRTASNLWSDYWSDIGGNFNAIGTIMSSLAGFAGLINLAMSEAGTLFAPFFESFPVRIGNMQLDVLNFAIYFGLALTVAELAIAMLLAGNDYRRSVQHHNKSKKG